MNDTRHLKIMIHAMDITKDPDETLGILLKACDSAADALNEGEKLEAKLEQEVIRRKNKNKK